MDNMMSRKSSNQSVGLHTLPSKMAKMMVMLLFGAASAYQGGGDQAYNTEDEHLSHGAAVGYGSIGMDTAVGFIAGIFFGIVITVALWYVFTSKKSGKKPQHELEMTIMTQ